MSIDTSHWGWPQFVVIVLALIMLGSSATVHGQPKLDIDKEPARHNFMMTLVRTAVLGFILICGGFFTGSR